MPSCSETPTPPLRAGRLPNRRRVIQALASAGAAGLGLLRYASQIEPHWTEFVRRDLPIAGLPDALTGKPQVATR